MQPLTTVLEEQELSEQQSGRDQSQPSTAEGNKRLRSEDGTPEQLAKKPRASGNKPTYGSMAGNVRVGIIHSDFPDVALTNERLKVLQISILKAVNQISADGQQVRFEGCSQRPRWF